MLSYSTWLYHAVPWSGTKFHPPAGVSFIMQELGGAVSVKRACVLDSSVKSSRLNPPMTFKVERSSGTSSSVYA